MLDSNMSSEARDRGGCDNDGGGGVTIGIEAGPKRVDEGKMIWQTRGINLEGTKTKRQEQGPLTISSGSSGRRETASSV